MNTNQTIYKTLNNKDPFQLIEVSRDGVDFGMFSTLVCDMPFSINDWSKILHISERTIQRYKRENRKFDSIHSDRLIEIILLLDKGIEVFGNSNNFTIWLESANIALGGIKPKDLLDNTFGIGLLKDELVKIEHGILA
ncbi:MAG: antitoxin Xre/MbcA/ParS toxin-binding domain-containing protein [Bacteroidota bacterium]|nr:antitoxin Xre/MbcA/ParS toxin-binding domain-containing protein [Bacteroidota bacterium]